MRSVQKTMIIISKEICLSPHFVIRHYLKGKFNSGIEGALASTLNHDFNWKQVSEIILCIFLLMFSKFI